MFHKCLIRINSIKNEEIIFNLLFSYLKLKSMNGRYITDKIFLYLSQSSLIPSKQVQTVLNDLISDLDSNEDLWLIKESEVCILLCWTIERCYLFSSCSTFNWRYECS
jgi:hypothetical protein